MEEIFVKNVLDVEVDGLRGTNRYIVKAQYDVRKEDARGVWYELKHKVIEDLTLTWKEIEEEGGVAEINKQFKECYAV